MITEKGQVKIMDFGLAKLAGGTKLTKTGTTLGTVNYMSPEQSKGKKVNHRSDIWSLGVVLYEMLTGKLPFKGEYEQAVVYSIVSEEPEPMTGLRTGVPMELEQIVNKCLEKSPSDRYQHLDELVVDLRRLVKGLETKEALPKTGVKPKRLKKGIFPYVMSGVASIVVVAVIVRYVVFSPRQKTAISDLKKLVVLPFENMGAAEDVYFADGITEEITTRLATVSRLGVISRNSAFHYAGKKWDTKQVGEELNVDFIVAGTVRWARTTGSAGRVRITPRLIRVSDDIQLWAEPFDRVVNDIFDIQSEIAMKVVEQLGITLIESEQRAVEESPTENLEAFQAFLQGRHYARSPHFTVGDWKVVIQSYKRAVELDPAFAMAYAELASAHARLFFLRHDISRERLAMAREAADRAEELEPESPDVLLALGYYYLWAYRDEETALAKWTLAGKNLPNDPRILEARANLLELQGRWEEAIKAIERAIQFSPRDAWLPSYLGFLYWMTRRYPKAIDMCNQAIALAPDEYWPYLYKAFATWSWKGANEESKIAIESVRQDYNWIPWAWYWQEVGEQKYDETLERLSAYSDEWIRTKMWARPKSMMKAFIYGFLGESYLARAAYDASVAPLEAEVQRWPEDPRYHSSLGIVYAALGRKEEAIREGKKAVELLSVSKDAFYGIPYEMDLSIIHVMLGNYDSAMDKVEHLLSIPSWISPAWLRMDFRYAPLYNHARFKKLMKKYSGDL
jgi:TolB-like protein/Flp pilus assembly protein TadD